MIGIFAFTMNVFNRKILFRMQILVYLMVRGDTLIDAKNYKAVFSSTVITLNKEYVEMLSV